MRIILADTNLALCTEWLRFLAGVPDEINRQVFVRPGDIFAAEADALVSPSNSYGFMDGGIDAAYSARFPGIQERVQTTIRDRFGGELLVGQALSLATGDAAHPLLIVAPTMRVPMTILNPIDVRLATRAAIRCALWHSPSPSVAFPGMGTGSGNVRPDWAASLMIAGIVDVLAPKEFPTSWQAAALDHYTPYLDGTAERFKS